MIIKNYLKTIWWVTRLQWRCSKLHASWVIFYNILGGFEAVVTTYALAQTLSLISQLTNQEATVEPSQIYLWMAVILAVGIFFAATNSYDVYVKRRLEGRLGADIHRALLVKIYSLSQQQLEDETFNVQFGRAEEGVRRLWTVINGLANMLRYSLSLLIALIVLLLASPWTALAVLISLIPVIVMHRRLNLAEEDFNRSIEHDQRLINSTTKQLTNRRYMADIRLLNGFKFLIQTWKRRERKIEQTLISKMKSLLAPNILAASIHPLVSFGVGLYFLQLLFNGQLDLASFILLWGILGGAISSSSFLAATLQTLHKRFIDLSNFAKIEQTESVIADGYIKVKAPLKVEFLNVNFKYPNTDNLILKDLSFKLDFNDRLAIVGSNGAGKTTLLKLLMRQYLPTGGLIKINNTDIRDLKLAHYYSLIGHLGQEFFLASHLTVADNLCLGLETEMSEEAIWQALDLAHATSFIKGLPKGLETRLDAGFKDGVNLSTGQRQRLCVARSLLKPTSLLILDEPTSAIDAKTEASIFSNIYSQQTDKGIIIISHRFHTIRPADKILVLKQGRLIEQGSHRQLMSQAGFYKSAFEIQAQGYRR